MTHGRKNSNVRPAARHTGGRKWLIGVPDTMATLRWRIRHRSVALKSHNIPEHIRPDGVYCPACGKGQVLSHCCIYCGCAFACFVILETPASSVSSDSIGPTPSSRYFSLFKTTIAKFTALSLRIRATVICVALLCVIVTTGGIIQYQSALQKQYTQNFILALYGIKSGLTMTGRVCNGKYSDSKEGVTADAPLSRGIDSQTASDLQTVKSEVDGLMAKLAATPAAYEQSAQILRKIYTLYGTMHTRLLSDPNFLSRCSADASTADKDFSHEIDNLKAVMPASLTKSFKNAGNKYDLHFMAL